MGSTLILGGSLLTSASAPLRPGWGVAIDGDRIADLGPNAQLSEQYPQAERVEDPRLLIMPGMVDSHLHAYGVLARGMPVPAAPAGFSEFLGAFWWPCVEDRLDQDMVRAAVALTCTKLIRTGVTSLCDVLEAPLIGPGALETEAVVLAEMGLRGVLSLEASERHGPTAGRQALQENVRFVRACQGEMLVKGMLSLHTSFTCSERFVVEAKEAQAALGCDIHLHLCESAHEEEVCVNRHGLRPVEWYDRLRFWDRAVLASQIVAVSEEDLQTLAERGVRVAHMPLSNCEVGGGFAPVPAMLCRGMRPGLGTDGYIVDMFEVMRGAFLLHKGASRDPRVVPAETVLAMATDWGAEAIGFAGLGELGLGRPADLIGVRLEPDTPLTLDNAADQLVLGGGPGQVVLSIVNGRTLMRGGELLGIDEERVRREALGQARRLWGRS